MAQHVNDDTGPLPDSPGAKQRVLVWYEGNSDTFFRISERIADRLVERLPPSQIGLSLTARAECMPRLRAKGYAVFPYEGPAGRERKLRMTLSIPGNFLRFNRILRRFRPDVIVLTSNFGLAWPLLELARLRGTKIIYLPHDPQPHSGDYAPLWQRLAQGQVLKNAHALIFLSDAMRETARSLGGAFATLPAFVAPLHSLGMPIVPGPRARVQGRPLRFLFLGRMIRYKGLDLLAEACRLIAERDDWHLTLAGDGPEVEQVRADFAGMPQVSLDHLRYLDDPEIDQLNLSHDVLICPYRDATQSGAVAEATLTGLPSIVSPVGALPSQVEFGRAGWVMAEMSADALASCMRAALDSPEAVASMSRATLDFWQRSRAENAIIAAVETVLGTEASAGRTEGIDHASRP